MKAKRVHWYIRGTGKTVCGLDIKRRRWTWTLPWKVTCEDCQRTEAFKEEIQK